jgi:hypothetical protein
VAVVVPAGPVNDEVEHFVWQVVVAAGGGRSGISIVGIARNRTHLGVMRVIVVKLAEKLFPAQRRRLSSTSTSHQS